MHAYVVWRIISVPWVASHARFWIVIGVAIILWAVYPLARILNAYDFQILGTPLEVIGANWIGVLFLLFSALLAADVCTLGGFLFPAISGTIRGCAVILAVSMSLIALIQGRRSPSVREFEVSLPGLPSQLDGKRLVALSDLHLGTVLGERWLAGIAERVAKLEPDLIVIPGDLFDSDAAHVESMLPTLRKLRAPMGVWAVTGNHEYYAGPDRCVALMESAGYTVLRDRWAEAAPGLIIAGVDDLTARDETGSEHTYLERALKGLPKGGIVFLSHTPWGADGASAKGVGLMLSGHTHNGQIWPFNLLVRLRYPFLCGE